MWKRRILIGLAALAVLSAGAWFVVQRYAPNLAIELTEQELQTRLAARFPIQNCALIVACLDITTPKLTLAEGSDRIALAADLSATLLARRYTGTLAFSGKVRYVAQDGEFFLDDIEIHRFELDGVPPKYTEILRNSGPTVLRSVLSTRPIYTLKGDTTQMRLARLAVADVRVVNGKLRVSMLKPTQ
jgi:Protein of unknown function (DUF1439)